MPTTVRGWLQWLARCLQLLAAVLQIVHRVIATFLIQQTELQHTEAKTDAVTLRSRSDPPLTKSPGAILNSRRLASPNGVKGMESQKKSQHPCTIVDGPRPTAIDSG